MVKLKFSKIVSVLVAISLLVWLVVFLRDVMTPEQVKRENRLQAQLDQTSHSLQGNFSFIFYDVQKQETFSYQKTKSDNRFYTASIVKVPVLAQLLLSQQSDGSQFSSDLTNEVRAMIRSSDDDATTEIITQNIGGYRQMSNLYQRLGMKDSIAGNPIDGWGYTVIPASDYMILLKNIFVKSDVLSTAQRHYIESEMEQVIPSQRWGISHFTEKSEITDLALKNGWGIPDNQGGLVVNTVGSVTLKDKRQFLIVALGDGFETVNQGVHEQE